MRQLLEKKEKTKNTKRAKTMCVLYFIEHEKIRRGAIYEQLPVNMLCYIGTIAKKFIK